MNRLSRKIVAILAVIFAQSSLGTTYAKSDLSNVMTLSFGTNGYSKFNNGLLIQWGTYNNTYTGNVTIYMPMSFNDTSYSVISTNMTTSGEYATRVSMPYSKSMSYFSVRRRYVTETASGDNAASIMWIAIGSWK